MKSKQLKKLHSGAIVSLILLTSATSVTLTGCSNKSSANTSNPITTTTATPTPESEPTPDYPDVTTFEQALNAGEDLTGQTVTFTVDDFAPNSAFGYNLQSGEHLNFVSPTHPGIQVGDTVTVKVTEIQSVLGSWIISYDKI